MNKFYHLFIPHPETHKKAHLISTGAIAIYLAFFITLQFFFGFINLVKPGVLGINSAVNQQELIKLTNEERIKLGLPVLKENLKLNQAALEKAKNMFEENYWSHYSPSGKDPWGFFYWADYQFIYAGENLAKNFYNSQDVVQAWMNSKTHKDNIINSKYQEIGIAVLEGQLNNQPTLLIVQEFGTPIPQSISNATTKQDVISSEKLPEIVAESEQNQQALVASVAKSNLINSQKLVRNSSFDPYLFNKNFGLGLIVFISGLILVDLYVLRRRVVYRISTNHLPHLALLAFAGSGLINSMPKGSIV